MPGHARPIVAVSPPSLHADHRRLFASLEAACGVRFIPGGENVGASAMIVAGEAVVPSVAASRRAGTRVLALAGAIGDGLEDVKIGGSTGVADAIRGTVLPGQRTAPRLELDASEEVLAHGNRGPAWTRTRDGAVFRVRTAVPAVGDLEVLRTLLGPDERSRTLAVLAIVAFLRELTTDRWNAPARRATFIFDDPNLRRVRYGHIDYRRLAEEAARHSYHVNVAMAPIDARYPGGEAVALFRAAADRLSLVVHGNNHTREELLRITDQRAARTLVAQALRRVDHFERRTGLGVGRVMVPPHGMASRSVAAALSEFGFDGLCALHPTPWTERPPGEWLLTGWTPATFVDGCTVIRRIPLDAPDLDIAVGAFLGQPVILYGHHGDLAPGYDVLARAAERVAGLGPVAWCSLRDIVRANYQLRVQDGAAEIRPWGTTLDVVLPAEVERLTVVAPPALGGAPLGVSGWVAGRGDRARRAFGEAMETNGARRTTVRLIAANAVDPRDVPNGRLRPGAWVRRRVAEIRDRVSPAAVVASSAIMDRA
jgi:hypothetical protein